ncbi:hypothetical protein CHELA40_13544 [Chelatococcus asaccharovorans]|nr:hypothetical protein CHELA40_13544 [Chelatococcus asaccharovorans]
MAGADTVHVTGKKIINTYHINARNVVTWDIGYLRWPAASV